MRILVTLLATFAVFTAAPVLAQTAPDGGMDRRLELADRYLELSQGSSLTKAMRRVFEDAFLKSELPQDERVWLMDNLTLTMEQVVAATFRDLRDDVAELFTEAELEASIAFMDSPLGRSITDKSLTLSITTQEAMAPYLVESFTKLGEKYCARFECEADEGGLAKD